MDWQCDLYIYGAEDGWAVHVAGNRIDMELPPIDWTNGETFAVTSKAQMAMIDNAPRVPIGGPHDSKSFFGLDDEELIETLTMLQGEGYRFPEDLIALVKDDETS
jgi:hypothetical protein